MNDKKIELALLKIISEMVECPAGSFMMGSPKDELGRNIYGEGIDYETQHKVAITKPFWIGKFLITREQYETIMEEEPISYYDKRVYNSPVNNKTYNEAKQFCKKLNKLLKNISSASEYIPNDYHFDLPTEAQWEYACRAGTTKAFNSNDNLSGDNSFLQGIAWYSGSMLSPKLIESIRNEHLNYYEKSAQPSYFKDILSEEWVEKLSIYNPVGTLLSNDWGIFDMHGNMHEWVRDTFNKKCDYDVGNAIDPIASEKGNWRVLRGGSYKDSAEHCRSAARYFVNKNDDLYPCEIGFRVALVSNLTYEENVLLKELEKECKEFWKNKGDDKVETLIQAIKNNKDFELIKRLISECNLKEINSSSSKIIYDESSPLTAAAYSSDNPELIKLLLDCGENTSFRDDIGYTALQQAAGWNSNFQVFNVLLENSKENDFYHHEFGSYRENALCLALTQNKNIEIIKRLIEYDPTENKDKDYYSKLLIEVAGRGYNDYPYFKEIVELLIEKGAEINKIFSDSSGEDYDYALGTAVKYNDYEAVKTLLDLGADPNLIVKDKQNLVVAFPLYDCIKRWKKKDKIKILELLLSRKANINQKLTCGCNIAMETAKDGDLKTLKFLINYEKDLLKQEDKYGKTVLDYCIHYQKEEDNLDCLRFLIEAGADVNHKNKLGRKAIATAFDFNRLKAIDVLLEAGTTIDEENFMLIKSVINFSCLEPYEKIKLLKRLYEIVGKKLELGGSL